MIQELNQLHKKLMLIKELNHKDFHGLDKLDILLVQDLIKLMEEKYHFGIQVMLHNQLIQFKLIQVVVFYFHFGMIN